MTFINRLFDAVYWISLERRAERCRSLAARLARCGIQAERIEAVDGAELETERRRDGAREGNAEAVGACHDPAVSLSLPLSVAPSLPLSVAPSLPHSHSPSLPLSLAPSLRLLSAGELGCLLSHRRTIERARRQKHRRVLVLEDDACLHRRFAERLAELEALGDDWDLLYLGASQYQRRNLRFVSEYCYRARQTFGTFAYAMHRRLFDKFLAVTESLDAAVDVANNCLVCHPPLAIADVSESAIRGPRDLARHAERMGWVLSEYDVPVLDRPHPGPLPEGEGECPLPAADVERLSVRADAGNPKSKIENPKSPSGFPACGFRSIGAGGAATCGHPQVRADEGIVTREACASCGWRETPENVTVDENGGWPSQAVPCEEGALDGSQCRLSLRERAHFRGAKGDNHPLALNTHGSLDDLRDGLGRPSSGAFLSRSERATVRPTVLLAIDRFGWAFHADAEGLAKHLGDEFAITIVPHRELTRGPEANGRHGVPGLRAEGDLLVAFWWQSLLSIDTSRVGAVVCGLFDTWSWDVHGPAKLQAAFDKADVLLVSNAYILDDLRNHPFGFRPPAVFVCEEGVDCEIFRPQSFPQEFCVGWAGTTVNARGFRGVPDGKGLGLIQEAARLAGMRLVSAEREGRHASADDDPPGGLRLPLATASGTRQCAGDSRDVRTSTQEDDDLPGGLRLPLATGRQIAHEAMPEEYYRRISAHCVGSYSEGAPLTVAEALACGRPVISTNVGIVPQLVQHGVNGLVVPREAAALAAAMRELKRLGPGKLADAARRSALLFDWGRQAPKWAHCFRSALDLASQRTHERLAPRPEYAAGEWQINRR